MNERRSHSLDVQWVIMEVITLIFKRLKDVVKEYRVTLIFKFHEDVVNEGSGSTFQTS